MMLALTWLRKWGTWILVGVLLALVAVLWLMLRALRAKREAHALADTVLDLGREADWAYSQARGDVAGEQADGIESEIKGMVGDMDATLQAQEAKREDPNDMDEQALADEFNRRLDGCGGDPDRGAGI